MERKRNRNMGLVLIGVGIFLLANDHLSFLTIVALSLLIYGVYQIRAGTGRKGYVFMLIGLLLLVGGNVPLMISIVLISLGLFYNKTRKLHQDDNHYRKQSLIDSIRWGREPWILRNMSVWNVLAEIQMDLTYAIPEQKETTIVLQGIVGDLDVIVPEDVGLSVTASVFIGQTSIGYDKEAGVMNRLVWQSPNYWTADRQVKLELSYVVADVDIKIV
ncbi:cell wall-active antibiotics response protein LiaF [Paenibacillus sp. YYML68]|uniref:cell wall-active antibiotics response protein LiaF n=1 Tax=Paenibacillus sp. YYML68 TaxID=2909250 RepID=UPI00248FBA44|nr:cell wall-active antibiotics response protein LiaF [Paenibacillus sp. YYML68]